MYWMLLEVIVIIVIKCREKHSLHGRETISVVPIMCVYVTRKFDYSDCTKIRETFGDISVIHFSF